MIASSAHAAYVISVVDADTGASVGFGVPGERLHLALLMTGTGEFDSFGVGLQTTSDGIHYGDYALAPGKTNQFGRPLFVTDGLNDFSNPASGYFMALTEERNTYWAGNGHLITFEAFVDPSVRPTLFVIEPDVDFFSRGFDELEVSPGRPFVFWIIGAPIEPTTLALLGIGALAMLRRRLAPTESAGDENRMIRIGCLCPIVLLAVAFDLTTAHAAYRTDVQSGRGTPWDYVISVVDAGTGLGTGTAAPGDTLRLAIYLQGAGNVDSFGVYVLAKPEAILFTDTYALAPDRPALFVTRGANDFSEPENGYFAALTEVANTYWNGNGYLVTFDAIVDPPTTAPETTIEPFLDPSYYPDCKWDECWLSAGEPFVLTIVPEPTALAFLGVGGLLAAARRKARRDTVGLVGKGPDQGKG